MAADCGIPDNSADARPMSRPPHLLIPFAACSAEAWLPTLQALPPDSFKRLGQLLQGMKLVETDTQNPESLSPPHERALARALGLATLQTPDGLMPWAAQRRGAAPAGRPRQGLGLDHALPLGDGPPARHAERPGGAGAAGKRIARPAGGHAALL